MFKVFQHVLPNARAWRLTIAKPLRSFFEGLGDAAQDVRTFLDEVQGDLWPETTRALDEWESQFALDNNSLTEQERRDRLDATWKALGGQSPYYIQTTLQANGFDVYIHEWFEPSPRLTATLGNPAITAGGPMATAGNGVIAAFPPVVRNPLQYIRGGTGIVYIVECGEAVAECGELEAQCGNSLEVQGYPLVNRTGVEVTYTVPNDPTKWPYFLYIGAEAFGEMATVPPARKDEFEKLLLKICPTHVWIGVLVTYT